MTKIVITFFLLCSFVFPLSAQYHYNQAGSFNGTSSYVAIPSGFELNITGSFTVECWINPVNSTVPSFQNVVAKRLAGPDGYELYLNNGRVTVRTNGSTRLSGTTVLPNNVWSHIAVTYNSSTTTFMTYVNGVSDGNIVIAGTPTSNTDSLYFSKGINSPFAGILDEIRIWNISRTGTEIARDRFIPLAIIIPSPGAYNGIVGAWRLNGNVLDEAGVSNNAGAAHNLSYLDLSQKPVNYVDYNNTLLLDGTNGYCSVNRSTLYDATTAVTLEAWIKRDTTGTQPSSQNIVNKSGGTNRYNYALWVQATGEVWFQINAPGGPTLATPVLVTLSRWTHVAAKYNSATGLAVIYVNGDSVASGTFSGTIQNDPDSAYVGGIGASSFTANKFKGQIDQVRIWKDVVRTSAEIKQNMYRSIDYATSPTPVGAVVWGFDGRNSTEMVGVGQVPQVNFMGTARLTSAHRQQNLELTSPLLRDDAGGFGEPTYRNSTRRFFVPDNNLTGVTDSVFVSATGTVTDIKAFVLMNHTWVADMIVTLISPTGVSVNLLNVVDGSNNDVMTIFTDASDSTTTNFLSPFSPMVKPTSPLSAFLGLPRQGWWKLKFVDAAAADLGYVSGWGIQTSPLVDVLISAELPEYYELMQNYPNPFNPSTTIKYSISTTAQVKLVVFDILGREVAKLVDEEKKPGTYAVDLNASHLATGVYFYRLQAGGFVDVKKMMLLK